MASYADYMANENQYSGIIPACYDTTVNPLKIKGNQIFEGEDFWNWKTRPKEDYLEMASHIPEINDRLQGLSPEEQGKMIKQLQSDEMLGPCATQYFDPCNRLQVTKIGDDYKFEHGGRHRFEAAKEYFAGEGNEDFLSRMPVRITGQMVEEGEEPETIPNFEIKMPLGYDESSSQSQSLDEILKDAKPLEELEHHTPVPLDQGANPQEGFAGNTQEELPQEFLPLDQLPRHTPVPVGQKANGEDFDPVPVNEEQQSGELARDEDLGMMAPAMAANRDQGEDTRLAPAAQPEQKQQAEMGEGFDPVPAVPAQQPDQEEDLEMLDVPQELLSSPDYENSMNW